MLRMQGSARGDRPRHRPRRRPSSSRPGQLGPRARRQPATRPVVRTAIFDATERRAYERELLRAKRAGRGVRGRAPERWPGHCSSTLHPAGASRVPGLDVAAAYRPAGDGDEVGGDFYDVFQIGGGRLGRGHRRRLRQGRRRRRRHRARPLHASGPPPSDCPSRPSALDALNDVLLAPRHRPVLHRGDVTHAFRRRFMGSHSERGRSPVTGAPPARRRPDGHWSTGIPPRCARTTGVLRHRDRPPGRAMRSFCSPTASPKGGAGPSSTARNAWQPSSPATAALHDRWLMGSPPT